INCFEINGFLTVGEEKKNIHISTDNSFLGIMAPSGWGKSSLLESLAWLNDSIKGNFNFQDSDQFKYRPWQRKVVYLHQNIHLLPHLDVRKNILFPKNAKLLPEVLEGLKIESLLERMPRKLSGGEKQSVGLARALSSRPDYILLDEPFSSIDRSAKVQ